MPIQMLPEDVASQIAAGEVVERPASVVKELLENALDAGATEIRIHTAGAGRRLIEIADDGAGIPAEELPLAVARHATSKLSRAEDLFQIETLGFRGEALASIGSVSRLTLTSRTTQASAGARLRVEGGRLEDLQAAGAPVGTVVRVEDLFYNVPARLKFLKQDSTERQAMTGLVMRYAAAYPRVRFKLIDEEKPVLQTSGSGDQREALASLYGVEVARQMLELRANEDDLRISGFISPTTLTRSNRREITFFINGRWVQDTPLTSALVQAYHTLLMVGRYPLAVVFLEIPPDSLDVNVHPAKSEVRFRSPDRIFSGVQRAVRRALLAFTPVPAIDAPLRWTPQSMDGITQGGTPGGRPAIDPAWDMPRETTAGPGPQTADPMGLGADPQTAAGGQPALPGQHAGAGGLPLLRLIGQIGSAYLVAEGPDGLYLIDQHAAHERVLFEKLMGQHDAGARIPAQGLLQPASVQLSPAAASLLSDQLPVLDHLGFGVEAFGPNTFLVRSIPALLGNADPGAAIRALVEDFEEDETPLQAEIEARLIARVCKRAAVKAGQTLSVEEQRALVHDLENCQSPRTCPHGRPTMIHLPVDLLERQFGRRGAR